MTNLKRKILLFFAVLVLLNIVVVSVYFVKSRQYISELITAKSARLGMAITKYDIEGLSGMVREMSSSGVMCASVIGLGQNMVTCPQVNRSINIFSIQQPIVLSGVKVGVVVATLSTMKILEGVFLGPLFWILNGLILAGVHIIELRVLRNYRDTLHSLFNEFEQKSFDVTDEYNSRIKSENDDIAKKILQLHKEITQKEVAENVKNNLYQQAKKVAHDIRSPLSALKILAKTTQELPDSKRHLLSAASERIESIANDLLKKSKEESSPSETVPRLAMVAPIADSILLEKKLEYQKKSIRFVKGVWQDTFSNVNEQSLKSIISNLINNSVEAGARQVKFELLSSSQIELKITDNGSGIPSKVLDKLGKEQITTKSSGHGIGLSSAFATVKSWGGDIKIESESGKGASITIQLPKAKAPEWYVPEINLREYEGIVVCDDDESIHRLFDQLFTVHEVVHFSSVSKFTQNSSRFSGYLVFMDNEFQGENLRGIDVVAKLANSILMSGNITGELMDLVEKKKVKFSPKSCLPSLKIVSKADVVEQSIQPS